MQQNLKVLMLNGSPRANGNTSVALKEMEQVFKDNGIETEIILVGNKDIRGCIACSTFPFISRRNFPQSLTEV